MSVLLCLVGCALGYAAPGNPPPASVFGTLPRTSSVDLSPDGKLIAWCDQGPTPQHILVFDRTQGKVTGNFALPEQTKLRFIAWAGDETLLFNVSWPIVDLDQKLEVFRTFSLDLASGKPTLLLMKGEFDFVADSTLIAWQTTKPNTVIMSKMGDARLRNEETGKWRRGRLREAADWVSALYEVDTRTGVGKRIETGDDFTEDWVVNGDGAAVARSEWNPDKGIFRLLAKHGLNWDQIYHREDGRALDLYGFASDGKSIVAISPQGKGETVQLLALSLDGSAPKVLLTDPKRDVTEVLLDRFDGRAVGARLSGIQPETRWLDPTIAQHVKALEASFPGRSVELYGRDREGMHWIARVSGPSAPAVYYLIDYASHRADIVGEEYPDLTGVKLGEVQPITYRARDGTEIPAYLTRPPDSDGELLPLIVMPHGGPHQRDDFEFDWWAQFLATRGYLVLQPQFRGSIGFGAAFADAHQWAGVMLDDVTDGARALIDRHAVDPHRICIVGASYGGYSALASAAFVPGMYACAVSVNGVADLPSMARYDGRIEDIGSASDPRLANSSPYRFATQIATPILLIHSLDDTVVPSAQSQMMWSAMHHARRPVKLVTLKGDDHWLSHSETRVRMLEEVQAFLRDHL